MKFRKSEGRNFNDVTVATVVFDDNGKFVTGGEKFVNMRLLDASIERMGHTGFVVKSTFDLKAGNYLVRQVVVPKAHRWQRVARLWLYPIELGICRGLD